MVLPVLIFCYAYFIWSYLWFILHVQPVPPEMKRKKMMDTVKESRESFITESCPA